MGNKGSLNQHELRQILTKAYEKGKEQKDLSLIELMDYLEKELDPYFLPRSSNDIQRIKE